MKQSYQEQVTGQATLLKHPHTSWTPLSMVDDFDNDIIINTYDIKGIASCLGPFTVALTLPLNAAECQKWSFAALAED